MRRRGWLSLTAGSLMAASIASSLLTDLSASAATPKNSVAAAAAKSAPAKPPSPPATIDAAKGSAAPNAPGQMPANTLPNPARVVAVPVLDFRPSIHEITPPHDEPFLPAGPGREAFVANCVTCHSARYVTNQTIYPRKTWAKEVKKMATVYGAPIPPEQIQAITDYLVSFHGKEDAKP